MFAHSLSGNQGKDLELKSASIRHQLGYARTFLVCSDNFQINWTVKGRRGKGLELLWLRVVVHNVRVAQTSGVIHHHTLGANLISTFFVMACGEKHYLFLTV